MKPAPPDEKRIEIVINGDQPETHRAAVETARILSAMSLIPAIRKGIEECRERVDKVSRLIVNCDVFVDRMKAFKPDAAREANKIIQEANAQTAQYHRDLAIISTYESSRDKLFQTAVCNAKQIERAKVLAERLVTLTPHPLNPFPYTSYSLSERVTPAMLLPLVPFEDMQIYIDTITRSENVGSLRHWEDLSIITECHEKIAQLLKAYLPKLQAEMAAQESELRELTALVRGK